MLNAPDIGDMFAFAYPAGAPAAAPALNFDPGRVRVEALFRALYGDCQKGTLAKTRKVPWVPKHGGGSVTFTTAQGADKALEAVSAELDQLPKSFTKYLVPSAGTYNCRAIAGTDRMSMHAYAAAIDINTKQTTYWQWVKPGADGLYHWSNKIPPEIVAAFEKHGFIWGGRWYHYDTMHFEYRPELLPRQMKSRSVSPGFPRNVSGLRRSPRKIDSADDLGVGEPVADFQRRGFRRVGAVHRVLADRQRHAACGWCLRRRWPDWSRPSLRGSSGWRSRPRAPARRSGPTT